MYIEKPVVVQVSMKIGPAGGYNENVYTFERIKTLSESTHREIVQFVDAVAATIKSETAKLTALQAALIKVRNNVLATQEEMKKIEHQDETEPEII